MFQGRDLCHQVAQIRRALPFTMALTSQLGIKRLPLVLLELFYECVLHLVEETAVELVPLGRLEIALLQDGRLAKHVYFATNVQIPAVDDLAVVLLLARVNVLHIVFCVFDDDLVGLPIQSEDNRNLVAFAIFNPPRFEA